MGPIDDDEETNTQKINEKESQPIDSDSEGSQEIKLTVLVEETAPIEEIQLLEDPKCGENERTQVLESDGEGLDRTEVLSDSEGRSGAESEREGGGDEGSGGGGDEGSGGGGDGSVGLGDKKSCGDGEIGLVPNSEGSTGEKRGSGSIQRNLMSVRTASLRASALAAARRTVSPAIADNPNSVQGSDQCIKELVDKVNKMIDERDPKKNALQGMEVHNDHDTEDSDGSIEGSRYELKCRPGSSTVRKLFTEDALPSDNVSVDDDEIIGHDHEPPELSYVESQEPGELSQDLALKMVDKFLSVNDEELSPEGNVVKASKQKLPRLSSAKGIQLLAQRANIRSPIGQIGAFDWDDSREDDRGGEFFSKRKESLFGSDACRHGSLTEPQKPRRLSSRKATEKKTIDKPGSGKESLNLHQKIMGLTRSDSKLIVQNLKGDNNNLQRSKRKTRKNLFEGMEKQPNPETLGKQLNASGISKDSVKLCDVGIDTQMAAEAMEALVCGVPAKHNKDVALQAIPNAIDDIRGLTRKKALKKQAALKKKSSDSGGILTRSKKRTLSESTVSPKKELKSQTMKKSVSGSENRGQKRKTVVEEHHNTENATTCNKISRRRSSISVDQIKAVIAEEKDENKEVNKSPSSLAISEVSLTKVKIQDYIISTPVARRTRQSLALNPLRSSEAKNLTNGTWEGTNEATEVPGEKRRRRSLGFDAPQPLSLRRKSPRLGSDQIDEFRTDKQTQQEASDQVPDDGMAACSSDKNDERRYPRQRVTHCNVSNHSNGVADGARSKVDDRVEANGHSITKQKKLNADLESRPVNLDSRRRTRSSAQGNPSSSSTEKKSEGSMKKQEVAKDRTLSRSQVQDKVPKHSGKQLIPGSTSSAKDTAVNTVSPAEKTKPSGSICVTPVDCTTPANAASPVCIGEDYHKQSCKKNLSRSALMRELVKLDANEASHISPMKDLRKKKEMAHVRVLFSHRLDDDVIKQQKKILARLGASVASSSFEATHFVTDKFVRTSNMLEAIALGKPVVTHLWLESCGQASCFIDEKNYILRDSKKEKEIGFSMPVSLARASQRPLLQNKKVFVTPNVKPSKQLIAGLVKAVQGQAVERIGRSATKDDKVPDEFLVLSSEEDYKICLPLLENGATVYSSELLLNGIVIQKLEYARHCLFTDHVRRTRSTIWLKDGDQFLPVTKRK